MDQINTMYFKLRDDTVWVEPITGPEFALELIMQELFSNDDYVFKFDKEPGFENVSPHDLIFS